ncbi:MAG: hypothetical protein L6V35_03975 [Alistipes putredinis]|nr:MAG: hypothetical protein L6V35_03975 [Alistipes putredinis]
MTAKAAYSSIRFRRWSRASYAVFASLHRAVSIGRISADIADASLSKKREHHYLGTHCGELSQRRNARHAPKGNPARKDSCIYARGAVLPRKELNLY